ncbi:MAG: GNAT family N-acetyltransferase, partial [Thermomonas sp.]
QRFYGRHGFEYAGEYAFIVGEQRDREFMYRRKPAV